MSHVVHHLIRITLLISCSGAWAESALPDLQETNGMYNNPLMGMVVSNLQQTNYALQNGSITMGEANGYMASLASQNSITLPQLSVTAQATPVNLAPGSGASAQMSMGTVATTAGYGAFGMAATSGGMGAPQASVPGGWLGVGNQSGLGGYGFSGADVSSYPVGGAAAGPVGVTAFRPQAAAGNPWSNAPEEILLTGTESEVAARTNPFGNAANFAAFMQTYGNNIRISPDGTYGMQTGNSSIGYAGTSNVNFLVGRTPMDFGLNDNYMSAVDGINRATAGLPGQTLPEQTQFWVMQPGNSPYNAPNICGSGACSAQQMSNSAAGLYQFDTNTGALRWNASPATIVHETAHAIDDQVMSQNPMISYTMAGAFATATQNGVANAAYMQGFSPTRDNSVPYVLENQREFNAETFTTRLDVPTASPSFYRGGVQTSDQLMNVNPAAYHVLTGLVE